MIDFGQYSASLQALVLQIFEIDSHFDWKLISPRNKYYSIFKLEARNSGGGEIGSWIFIQCKLSTRNLPQNGHASSRIDRLGGLNRSDKCTPNSLEEGTIHDYLKAQILLVVSFHLRYGYCMTKNQLNDINLDVVSLMSSKKINREKDKIEKN